MFKEHTEGKELPSPPVGKTPYDGWAYLGDKFKAQEDKSKWLPLRDAVGDKICPLMTSARSGGGTKQAACIHQDCAFYTEIHEPIYAKDENGQIITETQSDGRVLPKLEEECVKGFCAIALLPSQLYTNGALLKRISAASDNYLREAYLSQQQA